MKRQWMASLMEEEVVTMDLLRDLEVKDKLGDDDRNKEGDEAGFQDLELRLAPPGMSCDLDLRLGRK